MTDALFDMKDAPEMTPMLIWLSGNGFPLRWTYSDTWGSTFDRGWLPLPADASSKAVADTAAKWLSRCSDEDVAAVIRDALKREGVRNTLSTGEQSLRTSIRVLEAIADSAQEPSDD